MNTKNKDKKENPDESPVGSVSVESSDDNAPNDKLSEGVSVDEVAALEEGERNKTTSEDSDEELNAESIMPTYEDLQSEVAAIKDQLLRSLAEGENIRRRTEREKTDMSKYAITNFAREIISVADNLTRALGSISEESRSGNEELANLCLGIEMTDKELTNTFEKFNIKAIDAIGQKFDHNIHQAMFEVEDPDRPAGVVVQEIQKGYVLFDRLLRPAMVGVSKGGPKSEATEENPPVVEPATEQVANDSSSAYEKQSDVVNQATERKSSQLDEEL
jgi:molecular chaperone GrpE